MGQFTRRSSILIAIPRLLAKVVPAIGLLIILVGLAPLAGGRCFASPAAAIPVIVLTEANAFTTSNAEVGDSVEVRLLENAHTLWAWAQTEGAVLIFDRTRVEYQESENGVVRTVRVFRFNARAVGLVELQFKRGGEGLRFSVRVR